MIETIRLLLGSSSTLFGDELLKLLIRETRAEVESYCGRAIDEELEYVVERIVIIKCNRLKTEGLNSQSVGGVTENYIDGYPQDILNVLKRKRKIKVI